MTGLSPARKCAYQTLTVARERHAYARELLNSKNAPESFSRLSAEDQGFVRRLVLGVTATSGTLDECIDPFVKKPAKLDTYVRDALRLGAYEVLFLGKPDHVVVSQTVELVKTRAKSAAGLVNAVMHRIVESSADFMASADAHRWGLPTWLVDRLGKEYSQELVMLYGASCLEPAPLYLATMPQAIDEKRTQLLMAEAGCAVRSCGPVPGSWRVRNSGDFAGCKYVAEGKVIASDLGAQMVAYLAAPEPADRVLEIGAGRGTKTLLMAGHTYRAGGAARVWAIDDKGFKKDVNANRLSKLGIEGVKLVTADGTNLDAVADLPAVFDVVLIDAPCSGTGTLRRHPEITWELTETDIASCAKLQSELLASAAARVAHGGKLVYATCSVLAAENQDVVNAFLASEVGAGFEVVPVDAAVKAGPLADFYGERMTKDGFLATFPEPASPDGHFAAVLRRK